ncbi:MAG TPA: PadR family transcriptional regulator [Acidobacteria bacterium]|nr:PadR family transcriptional regulator [Acidobacteriota bacterium]
MVLFALATRDRRGYGIVKALERQSAGWVQIDPANVYRAIKRMMASGP